MRILYITLILFGLSSLYSFSQVTIGMGDAPAIGALLDLKQNTVNEANSTKGVLLPRVSLTVIDQLSDISGVASDANSKLVHKGLSVYNTNASFPGGLGINIWDGTQWVNIQQPRAKSNLIAISDPGYDLLAINLVSPVANWKAIALPTEFLDTNGDYSPTTGVFTVRNSGTYNAYIRISFSGISVASTYGVGLYCKRSGGSSFSEALISTTKAVLLGVTTVEIQGNALGMTLNTGDQLMFAVRNNALSTLTTGSSGMIYGIVSQQ